MRTFALFLTLFAITALADTPPPGFVQIKGGTNQTVIGNSADSLKVTITGGGGGTVNQGTGNGGSSPWSVLAQQFGSWSLGVTSLPANASFNLNQISGLAISPSNALPISTTFSGSLIDPRQIRALTVSDAVTASQGGSWAVTANAGTGTFQTNVTNSSIPVTQSGTWTTGRTWSLLNTTDSVNVGNFPATFGVTQSTTPWVTNVSQFGGNAVVTGTGASGLGIPRFTVSNDSNILATQSGSWTVTANAGTNLNTSLLQLDSTGAKLNLAQGSTTSGQLGPLIQGAVTTAAPAYTTAQTSPLSLTPVGNLRVDGSSVTQPVSGTVAVSNFPASQVVTQATASSLNAQVVGNVASGASDSGNPVKAGSVFNTTQPTVTNGQRVDLQGTSRGGLIVSTGADTFHTTVDSSALPTGAATAANQTSVQSSPGSSAGTAITVQGSASGVALPVTFPGGSLAVNVAQINGNPVSTASTGTQKVGIVGSAAAVLDSAAGVSNSQAITIQGNASGIAVPVSQATASNLNATAVTTGGATIAKDSSVTALQVTQGSTTSGQSGSLIQGAVTTGSPTYTTAQTSPLSLTTAGALRTDSSATTQPVSGIVTAAQGTASTLSGKWPVQVTDGTNTMPTMDSTSRAGFQKITDGTNTAAVKGASTAAVATDASLVVGLSPNSSLPAGTNSLGTVRIQDSSGSSITVGQKLAASSVPVVTQQDASPATATVTAQDVASTSTTVANGQVYVTGTPTAGSSASFSFSSFEAIEVQVTGTWTGTLATEVSMDGGTTWLARGVKQSGASYISNSFTANFEGGLNSAGITNFRVRSTAAWTGTATVAVVQTVNIASVIVSNPQMLRDGTTQSVVNTIKPASTAAVAADPALVVAVSPNNNVSVVGNVASGTADSGNPVKVGGVFNSTQPTLTSGQRGDMQMSKFGDMTMADSTSYANITTATTTTVKSGAGLLYAICYNLTVNNSTVTIYDNTAGSGTKIGTVTELFGGGQYYPSGCVRYNGMQFNTGLTLVTSAATDLTVLYK